MSAPGTFVGTYRTWKSWTPDAFGRYDDSEARYFEVELSQSGITSLAGKHLLEVGFGNGAFAAWAKNAGAHYRGTELDPDLVSLGRERGLDAFAATLDFSTICPDDSQDVVVMFDVLEHLTTDEIVTLLRSVARILKTGGRLIARFPSGDSPFARAIQHGDATHRTAIGTSMLSQLAQGSGLSVKQTRSPAFPLTGLGIKRFVRRAPIAALRMIVGRTINIAFHDGQNRVLTANIVAVLQKS
ncbi:MAG TPA: class I SAM-dependent methyltransferase [Polyangium sp.]|nr:class I SAM-dependent methyltransferase [Polyangium sp.]